MVKIGTHSGTFHCDEALGSWMLHQTEKFSNAEIVRSRDPEVLKDLDIIIDVGGVYEADALRYDHHQRGFAEEFGHGYKTKLSSAGLVYKHHGSEVVAKVLGWPLDHADLQTVYLQVYKTFVDAVDAVDNGINQWDSKEPPPTSSPPLSPPAPPFPTSKRPSILSVYKTFVEAVDAVDNGINHARVGQLNPKWNEDSTEEILYAQFLKAEAIEYVALSWLPGRTYVKEALLKRNEVDPSGQIMRLDHFCPWKEHLYDLEKEMGLTDKPILFCLYEDDREMKWRIQAVSVGPGSFDNRLSMPEAWRGVRDDKLSEVAGIPGCVFCHAAGFIGGNATMEGVVEMARKSLAEAKTKKRILYVASNLEERFFEQPPSPGRTCLPRPDNPMRALRGSCQRSSPGFPPKAPLNLVTGASNSQRLTLYRKCSAGKTPGKNEITGLNDHLSSALAQTNSAPSLQIGVA
eukprot:gene20383-27154_t